MEDEAILLKIKRDFTTDEAVQSLLKIVCQLEMEIGVLKSEKSELEDKLANGNPRKIWLKDEVLADMEKLRKNQMKRNQEDKKAMVEWRNKYFSLLAKTNSKE